MNFLTILKNTKKHEGFRSKPYTCTEGKLTIGYGTNISDGIDEIEADFLLKHRLRKAILDLEFIFPNFADYTENRQHALIDMRYQLGHDGFRTFRKMIEAVKWEDWSRAAFEVMDSVYWDQVPLRAREIKHMILNG